MKRFKEVYAAGKISIKFYTLTPLVKTKKRKIIFYSLILLTILMLFFVLPAVTKVLDLPIVGCTLVGTFLLMLIIDVYSKNILFKIKRTGKVVFDDASLKQFDLNNNQLLELPYSKIKRIEYKKNVPKSAVFAYFPSFKTVVVRFIQAKDDSITIELSNDMFFSPEESSYFQKLEPNIERVLMEIKPRFGVERVNRIK